MKLRLHGRMEGYNVERFRKDLLAGVIVGIVALPLAMAFAIASGVSPDRGLYTAIVAGAAISIFGGSRVQIGGPTGAMVAILSVIVLQYGINNLLLAGLVAGLMLIVMGVLRAGALIRFIPFPVTTGFTSGIAVIIFTGQINNFFGLTGLPTHEQFHLNLMESLTHLSQLNVYAVATALIALAGILITPRITKVVPGSLIGMLVAACVVTLRAGRWKRSGVNLAAYRAACRFQPSRRSRFPLLCTSSGRRLRLRFSVLLKACFRALWPMHRVETVTTPTRNSSGRASPTACPRCSEEFRQRVPLRVPPRTYGAAARVP